MYLIYYIRHNYGIVNDYELLSAEWTNNIKKLFIKKKN